MSEDEKFLEDMKKIDPSGFNKTYIKNELNNIKLKLKNHDITIEEAINYCSDIKDILEDVDKEIDKQIDKRDKKETIMSDRKKLTITINLEDADFKIDTKLEGEDITQKDKNYLMIALHLLKENTLMSSLEDLNKSYKDE